MTSTTRQSLTGTALACCAAILLASPTRPLLADDVTFQFKTTIKAIPVGGSKDAPLVVTYTFDSEMEPLPESTPSFTVYYPIRMTLQVGDPCGTASGFGAIIVGNNWGDGTSDGYDVRFVFPEDVSGQLFGLDVVFFRFVLADFDATMLTSSDLPLSPAFASGTDLVQVDLTLVDPTTGNTFDLGLNEGPDTPPKDKTPFSLTRVNLGDPLTLLSNLRTDVVSLGLSQGLQDGLLAKLDDALQALTDGNKKNDHVAINKLEEFISQVSAQRCKKISEADADVLINEAENVIIVLLLLGC